MNCRRFQDQLFEYVDGSLSPSARAAAEKHLAGCDNCREAVRREEALALGLSRRLQQGVAALKLSAEIRREIMAVARIEPAPSAWRELITSWWPRLAVLLSAGATVLAVGAVLLLIRSPGSQRPRPETAQRSGASQPPVVSVQLSSRVPVCEFHRVGNAVIDTLSVQTVVANVTLRPLSEPEE